MLAESLTKYVVEPLVKQTPGLGHGLRGIPNLLLDRTAVAAVDQRQQTVVDW